MTAKLTKTAKVLQNEVELNTASRFTYLQRDEETGHVLNKATIERQVAIDLGNPREITVTIEPGNTLARIDDEEPGAYYDEDTLFKLQAVLMHNGYLPDDVDRVINDFLNAGLLIRERR